jgi:hypothetical protein
VSFCGTACSLVPEPEAVNFVLSGPCPGTGSCQSLDLRTLNVCFAFIFSSLGETEIWK